MPMLPFLTAVNYSIRFSWGLPWSRREKNVRKEPTSWRQGHPDKDCPAWRAVLAVEGSFHLSWGWVLLLPQWGGLTAAGPTVNSKEEVVKRLSCHTQSPWHGACIPKSSEASVGILLRWHFRVLIPLCACNSSKGIFSWPFSNGRCGVCPSLFSLCHAGFSVAAWEQQPVHCPGEEAGTKGLALRNPTEPSACSYRFQCWVSGSRMLHGGLEFF